jgi:hypothetical protein
MVRKLLSMLALAPLALCLTACVARPQFLAPASARAALDHINANLARLDRPVYGSPAIASFSFRDGNGRQQRFIGHPAVILFAAPSCLRFDVRHALGGKVAELGADDTRYWLFVDVDADNRKLWWGTWDALELGLARDLAVPPDALLEALLLRPLPDRPRGGTRPLLYEGAGSERILAFLQPDPLGWPHVAREVVLRRQTDYLPAAITDYDATGAVVMQAEYGDYRPIEGTGPNGPRTPHRYVVRWPGRAEMRVDLQRVRFRDTAVPCDFPAEWQGDSECLDLVAEPPTDTASPE